MERWGSCIACAFLLAWSLIAAARSAAAEGAGAPSKPGIERSLSDAADAGELERRLAAKGMAAGSPIMLRIFKTESELEVWVHNGARFDLFAVYPICNWSGRLGPKLTEGDRQSPEGLYSIGARQLHRTGRWRRSLDIGFPNTFDRAHGRTGSYILVHGGCTSTGCYAMTNPVMEEVFTLSEAALAQGQERIQVHVFPFRMTQENLAAHAHNHWNGFWTSLKEAYDLFERTHAPPQVSVCDSRYVVGENASGDADNCVPNVSEVSVASARLRSVGRARHARLARHARRARIARLTRRAVRSRPGHQRVGRNARQAYAAARVSRMAAYAKRRQASARWRSEADAKVNCLPKQISAGWLGNAPMRGCPDRTRRT